MITTPEIICDLFSFLDKDQIERIQLVNQFWNNVIIRHKNILPLREFLRFRFNYEQILLYVIREDVSYIINFDGTNLRKENVSSRYSQLTVDEVLTNLNDVFFYSFHIVYSENRLDDLLNMMKLVTMKTRLRGQVGACFNKARFGSKLNEIVGLYFEENEEILHFICKFNGANRLTIEFNTPETNCGNFIRQWFELYRTHQSPISLVGKFVTTGDLYGIDQTILDAVKTFLNNTQLRVKYSLETKESHFSSYFSVTKHYLKRRCVLHETDSYALVIEMEYGEITYMSSINASDLDQPPRDKMKTMSFCVKSL